MSKIALLTDSCCDLSKETIEELGIKLLPFTLTVGGESFRETIDKSTQEFYELLEKTDEIPKHSQISPVTFEEAYKELFEQGYTDIISVSINSQGSGTYNNSIIGKNDFFENVPEAKDKVRIFNLDSKCYTLFYGYPLMEAAKKIRRGADAEEIVAYLEDWFKGLKPVILFADGTTTIVDKIRGEKNIVPKLAEIVEKNMTPQTPYLMIHGKDNTLAKEVEKELYKKTGRKAEMYGSIGAVVTANIGPELVAVLVRRKNK